MMSLDTITTGQCSSNALNVAFLYTLPFGLQLQALIEGTCNLLTKRSKAPMDQPCDSLQCAELVSANVERRGLGVPMGISKVFR